MKKSDIQGKVKALGQKQVIKKRALADSILKFADKLKLEKQKNSTSQLKTIESYKKLVDEKKKIFNSKTLKERYSKPDGLKAKDQNKKAIMILLKEMISQRKKLLKTSKNDPEVKKILIK